MRSFLIFALSLFWLAPAAAQSDLGTQPNEIPAISDSSREKFEENAERSREAAQRSTPESRLALKAYAQCVVRYAPGESARVVSMDFNSTNYRTGLRMLSESSEKDCATRSIGRGKLRSAGLLFAGEVAEALIKTDATPTKNRLARAAGAPATKAFSFTDRIAICVVRSVPDQVAALFETERESAEESKAIGELALPAGLCARAAEARQRLSINPAGLRAMLATAAFRSIHSLKVPA